MAWAHIRVTAFDSGRHEKTEKVVAVQHIVSLTAVDKGTYIDLDCDDPIYTTSSVDDVVKAINEAQMHAMVMASSTGARAAAKVTMEMADEMMERADEMKKELDGQR